MQRYTLFILSSSPPLIHSYSLVEKGTEIFSWMSRPGDNTFMCAKGVGFLLYGFTCAVLTHLLFLQP